MHSVYVIFDFVLLTWLRSAKSGLETKIASFASQLTHCWSLQSILRNNSMLLLASVLISAISFTDTCGRLALGSIADS